ncbi:hypothetical protein CRN78_09745 [Klebsiella aerogenes]|nr:hypothetical protein CRN78_09745 [Klebsiella aerogenes]OUE80815.1 hypothetical protein AZ035_001387 [Klebsiella aerogenes]
MLWLQAVVFFVVLAFVAIAMIHETWRQDSE